MRVLVTGGAGFIGSNFVHHLLDETDHKVITLDALTYAGSKSKLEGALNSPRHRFVEGDIRNEGLVVDLIADVNAVVNFAAETHVDRSIEDATPFIDTNIAGTQTMIDAAVEAGIEQFVQISTDEVYGEILDGSFSEDECLDPRNPYSATKAGADYLVQSYYTTHDLPAIIIRPSNNYGPRQNTEKLIPKFIRRAVEGKSLPLYGDGSNVREWVYVFDICRAIEHVIDEGIPGEIYNVGSGHECTNLEVTKTILNEVGASKDLIDFVDDRPGHDERYSLNATKIRNLGWEPKWSFEQGIQRTVEYYIN